MIKINLISDEPTVAATRKKSTEISLGGHQGDIILLSILVIALVIAGGRWYVLHSKIVELQGVEAQKRAERDDLQQYIKKADELEAKRAELKKKIDTIRKLKEQQQGPVHILDELSRALPDLVWLTNLKLAGATVTLRGMALDENAIANYMTNLEASPYVKKAALKGFQRKGQTDAFSFELSCDFTYTPATIKSASGGSES